MQLYLAKAEKFSAFFYEKEPKEDSEINLLQESDAHLYEKFKKQAESASFFCVKPNISSLSTTNFAEIDGVVNLNNNFNNSFTKITKITKSPNKSVVIQENSKKTQENQETQDKTRLFEVSLEPSYKEQSLTAKRLSIMGKKTAKLAGNFAGNLEQSENSWVFCKGVAQEREKTLFSLRS